MCSISLNKPQKTVVLAAMYQLKRVTVAILDSTSLYILCCLMNTKVKSFKQCSNRIIKFFAVAKVTTRVGMMSFGTDTGPQSFCNSIVYCPANDTLFSQPRNPLFMCVKSLLFYGNHTAGSKPIKKLFSMVN